MSDTNSRPGGSADTVTDRRRNARHTTVLQIAKLCTERSEELCILRDVSPDGLKAEVYCPIAEGERITVELKTGHSLAGTVVWTREQMIGVQFHASVPMQAMLAHCSFDERLGKIRPPRIDVDLPGLLYLNGRMIETQVCNVSQGGVMVRMDHPLYADARCEIEMEEFGRRGASVRWCRAGAAGLLLTHPMSYGEFAGWRRAVREAGEA